MIKQDIEKEGVNHVVIAACSRRAKAETFNFGNIALNRTNLREGVIWITPPTTIIRKSCRKWPRTTCAWAAPK